MKIIKVKRNIEYRKEYHGKMGEIITRTTKVKKYVLGLPLFTLHQHRRKFHGELTSCKESNLFI